MGKRSPGHIEQLPSGSWRVKVYGGTDPLTGREIRLRKTFKIERAAQIELGKEQAAAGRQPDERDGAVSRGAPASGSSSTGTRRLSAWPLGAVDLPGSRWLTRFGTRSALGCSMRATRCLL